MPKPFLSDVTVNGVIKTTDTTASTSTTTGSLIVAGGLGVAGAINSGALTAPSGQIGGAALITAFNVAQNQADSYFTGITVINGTFPGTPKAGISFKCADWVQSAIWHQRSMDAFAIGTNPNYTDLTVNGVVKRFTIDNNGAADFQGNSVSMGALTASGGTFTGDVSTSATTASASTTTGSIKAGGGLGVVGNAYIGGKLVVSGSVAAGAVAATVGSGATYTPVVGSYSTFVLTLTASGTAPVIANQSDTPLTGQTIQFIIIQPSPTSAVPTWGTNYKFFGTKNISTTADGRSLVSCVWDGTYWQCTSVKDSA